MAAKRRSRRRQGAAQAGGGTPPIAVPRGARGGTREVGRRRDDRALREQGERVCLRDFR